jgi:hypothetical protein
LWQFSEPYPLLVATAGDPLHAGAVVHEFGLSNVMRVKLSVLQSEPTGVRVRSTIKSCQTDPV